MLLDALILGVRQPARLAQNAVGHGDLAHIVHQPRQGQRAALLGLKLERAHYERGATFAEGVVERAGLEGLNRLWDGPAMLPTPNEFDAPGLWLARIDLPDPD